MPTPSHQRDFNVWLGPLNGFVSVVPNKHKYQYHI